jgi:hypothetical protein
MEYNNMSFVSKSLGHPEQLAFIDRYEDLDPYAKSVIDESWAADLKKHVFLLINESIFECLYSDAGRPCNSIRYLISAEILKHRYNLSDKEIRAAFISDIRFQYAVDSTSKKTQPICERTLNRFRARILKYQEETGIDLLTLGTRDILKNYMKPTNTSAEKLRMDSFMISSHCKHMQRIDLMYKVIKNLCKELVTHGCTELKSITDKYYKKDKETNENISYTLKPNETESKMNELMNDAIELAKNSKKTEQKNIKSMPGNEMVLREYHQYCDGGTILISRQYIVWKT